ncbi:MAG: HypC/HybG/HupF family hydrogenase formation chaperone [Bacteroidales bacterium]|nr:HypC/HybG/HupF family hydrogenase formation chaperone [Bacteroidales bacterium]
MCLSLPAKVIEIKGDMADVSVGGTVFKAGLQLVDDVKPGDYVLLHAGFAIQKIDEKEAQETLQLLEEIRNSAG